MGFKLRNKKILSDLHGNVKPSILKFASPLKTHEAGHEEDVIEYSEYEIDPNDPNLRLREKTTRGTGGQTYEEAGVDPEEAKKYWEEHPEEYKEYLEGKEDKVEIEYQDRDVIENKKIQDWRSINRDNMRGDRQYPWEFFYENYGGYVSQPREGFDFGVSNEPGFEGKPLLKHKGQERKNYMGYITNAKGQHQTYDPKLWGKNIQSSYSGDLETFANDYLADIQANSGDPEKKLTFKDLTQEQHNEIYKAGHDAWFTKFKKAYPEIKWKWRLETAGKGSSSSHIGDWKDIV